MEEAELVKTFVDIINKGLELPEVYRDTISLYVITPNDRNFIKGILETPIGPEQKLDQLARLFIYLIFKIIVPQTFQNQNLKKPLTAQDRIYLLNMRGLLAESTKLIQDEGYNLEPYLVAFRDQVGGAEVLAVPEEEIMQFYQSLLGEASGILDKFLGL